MDRDSTELPMEGREGRDAARMRLLAGRYSPRGSARLALKGNAVRRLEDVLAEARRLRRVERVSSEALARLDSQAPVIMALARRALADGGARLPAWQGRPRLGTALEALLADGEPLTRRRLLAALRELDAAQALTLAELWAVPEALRTALSRGLLGASKAVVARARRLPPARRWARNPAGSLGGRSDVFLVAALKCAGEEELCEARRLLDSHLARRGLTAEALVARVQAEAAEEQLRLENLLAAARMLERLDWKACFSMLSRVELELRGEASGTYARMDEPSREAVRRQVAHIARRTGLAELAVARSAADAARSQEGVRGGVCWWLYDDAGRRELLRRMGRGGSRLRRLVPDPNGHRTMIALLALSTALAALFMAASNSPWLWAACVPLGWNAAFSVLGRFYSRIFPPVRLLKLKVEAVPEDCRTLVTLPVLLSSPRRAAEVCDQLEALGCLERDDNIEYLLLGDLTDAPQVHMPGDGEILARARERIRAMNERAGREKYALLCRDRSLLAADGVWMGADRKRGALMALNRLLLDVPGAEAAFGAEGAACPRLRGRFAYVLTLDADTRLLPEDVRRLIGAMAHPLNRPEAERGYAVLQPGMEPLPSGCVNGFVRLFSGTGGVNAYPVTVSNLWQDLTGRGIYAGKGIYHIATFQARLEGALPEGRVLSHDLAEGAVAGAGFAGDVAFYDGQPTTFAASLARRHRWIRGDWQLLPVMLSRQLPNGARLRAADRFRMLDNLMRSLRELALAALLVGGVWTGGASLPLALALICLEPALRLGDGDELKWRRAAAELATLPACAWSAADAVLRTLWRLGVSGKRLMEWVTAADAESAGGRDRPDRLPERVAALLMVPGLWAPGMAPVALALGLLFLIAPGWIADMERHGEARPALSKADRQVLSRLAGETWRFFADNVSPDACPLPPDNVQLDPPVGAARRTSPTNIALYLLSCLSARRLGLIGAEEERRRLTETLDALERMEKWRGQLYNWYDIDTLEPLRPRYVSSVDSGNLAAALLLSAEAAEGGPASRARRLARDMDLAALYDAGRELFAVGMDVETGRVSASHYDLLASEARILSFAAMMLGQAPTRHWQRLGRPCAKVGQGVAPLSWSGTMFEYLMPELLMPAPPLSLLGAGVRAAVRAQMDLGRRLKRPWGVSESGYCAFDAALNYQYRAFGLRALALDGEAAEDVVAPYAAVLAATVAPHEAALNLDRMRALGWTGRWGLVEAADYLHGNGDPALVMSHMAHHQGMALCALCNALTDGWLAKAFMGIPEAQALSLLLEERPCPAAPGRGPRQRPRASAGQRSRSARRCDPDASVPRTHPGAHVGARQRAHVGARQRAHQGTPLHAPSCTPLHGGGASALCTDDGAIHYRRGDVAATRFPGVLQGRTDAARTILTCRGGGAALGGDAAFEPGVARFHTRLGRLEADMAVCLSPEDGTLVRIIDLKNLGERSESLAVTDVVPVALCSAADWQAHGVFQGLFVQSLRPAEDALLFRRRPGSRGADGPRLLHLCLGPGSVSCETDYGALTGRMGDCAPTPAGSGSGATATRTPPSPRPTPGAHVGARQRAHVGARQRAHVGARLAAPSCTPLHAPSCTPLHAPSCTPLHGDVGATLNPASALRMALTLGPGGTARVCFALGLTEAEEPAERWLARWRQPGQFRRALRLSGLRAGAMLDFIGLDAGEHHALQRLAALLADGTLAAQARGPRRGEDGAARSALWPLGLSGDRPMLALFVGEATGAEAARALIRAHGFYRAAGLDIDLALVDDAARGYARPVRDMLERLVASSHLDCLRGVPGGAWLIDGASLSPESRRALIRFSSAVFYARWDFWDQVRALSVFPAGSRRGAYRAMDPGESRLEAVDRLADNGFGGFDGDGYLIDVLPEDLPPAPWCNILANERGGMLLSERGGGFFWAGNSRSGRLTPYGNDGLREGWGLMLYLADDARGELLRLLPGERPQAPFRVRHDARQTVYALDARRLAARVRFEMRPGRAEAEITLAIENRALKSDDLRLVGCVQWQMGEGPGDLVALNCWGEDGACLATGAMAGAGWFAAADPLARSGPGRCAFLGRGDVSRPGDIAATGGEGWTLSVPLRLKRGERRELRLCLGWAEDVASARARVRSWRAGEGDMSGDAPRGLAIETPDRALNALANGFLLHQVRASRVLGRVGLYQPGGAWGFRDQLQDMLALIHDEPDRVRSHLLRCAARQFEAGDVLHWWHDPFAGVRTRVSDDKLFLPWAVAAYVEVTGDAGVLREQVPYLEDVPVPGDRTDVYCDMKPGASADTLHGHCMRAFRAAGKGRHGLLLMGTGDWNDGMDRVGAKGLGESVWLSQFAAACADRYRRIAPDEGDRVFLWRLGEELRRAVETFGWDGGWYLRAYDDSGAPLGSAANEECRIDAVSQAWAVLAGLDPARCRMAMDAAWTRLVDEEAGIIRLLTPPFDGRGPDPGYIRGYPPGVRENGGQYTHGALWLLLALIEMGDARRAHRALELLLPFRHADTREKALVYRVEPYVMAADVYDRPGMRGRGGWTWYTGSAGWMYNCLLALLGYERRGERVRLNALLGDWEEASVTVRFGNSRYRLTCDRVTDRATLDGRAVGNGFVCMVDDGRAHEARFPARDSARNDGTRGSRT